MFQLVYLLVDWENLIYTTILGILQECGDFTWWVSDCEELVGGQSQEMMGLVLGELCHFFNQMAINWQILIFDSVEKRWKALKKLAPQAGLEPATR